MKNIIFLTAAIMILGASCGQNAQRQKTDTVVSTSALSDFSTEKGNVIDISNIKPHIAQLLEKALDATFTTETSTSEEFYEGWVYLKYKQPVNGYKVEAIFAPEEATYDKITGSAILRFKNQSTGEERQIASSCFALSWQNFPDVFANQANFISITESEEIKSFAKGQTYNLDYKFFENPGFLDEEFILSHPLFYGEFPFFFADLDFDGKEELILTQFRQGQRGCSFYIVYSFEPDSGDFYRIVEKPLDRLDDFSTIDRENRQIIIQNNNGADDSFEEVYKTDISGNFYLDEIR